jgi:hypothetical protein
MDPTKKELYTAKRSSNVDVSDPLISEGWEKVRSDIEDTNWIILYLSNPTTVSVKSVGSGGAEEFISNLNDDEILFGGLRAQVNDTVKFYHIYFVGSNVNALKKGKASMFESGIFQSLVGAHGKFEFSSGLEDISYEKIVEKIQKLSKSTNVVI